MEEDKEQIISGADSEEAPPSEQRQQLFIKYVQPCLAELVGTMIFVFIGTMSVSAASGSSPASPSPASATVVSLAHGFTIALLVASFGTISGGLFNPAVSLGLALSGALHPIMAVLYSLSQLVGGIVGAAITRGCMTAERYRDLSGAHTLAPQGGSFYPGMGVLCEAALTTILVLTILMTAVDTRTKSSLAPLAIGFAITVDIIAGFYVTGGSMNPARSLGPAVVVADLAPKTSVWTYHYVYWVGPITGAVVAAAFYRLIFGHSDKRLVFKQD